VTRVLRTAAATLEHTFYTVGAEAPTDSATTVTVVVTDANATIVASGDAASAGAGTGRYTIALPAQPQLNLLRVAWSATIAGAVVVETDTVEIVGGYLFSLAELRACDPALQEKSGGVYRYCTAELARARDETECECEEICDRAFVPRYRRAVLDGTGHRDLVLPTTADPAPGRPTVRTIRAARIATTTGASFVALTAAEVAALAVLADNTLRRTDAGVWPEGTDTVIVEYEHGLDAPPADLKRAALRRARAWLTGLKSGVPDRAISYTTADGANYRLDLPGAYKVGIPEVDAVYARYSLRDGAGAGEDGQPRPASRVLNYDPQRGSLYHGGIR
jgi:hypothetical protein